MQKNLATDYIFKTEDNVPAGKVKRKKCEEKVFFCILKVIEESSRIRSWIRIRTKNNTDPQQPTLPGTLRGCIVVPDDPALLPVLVCEEPPELSVENIAAHVCYRHNVPLLEKLALRNKR
jgi:hypothetical protein